MDFGEKWFDKLRDITEAEILDSRDSTYKAARLHTLAGFPKDLKDNARSLVKAVDCKRFPFDEFFRVLHPGHTFTYSKGGYLRRQWYIGFVSGKKDDGEKAFIGFAIRLGDKIEGWEDWKRFISKIKDQQAEFRSFFENNLNWIEMGGRSGQAEMIDELIQYKPSGDDWVFIGKCYMLSDSKGIGVLTSVDSMAKEAIDVFECLTKSGFTAGL